MGPFSAHVEMASVDGVGSRDFSPLFVPLLSDLKKCSVEGSERAITEGMSNSSVALSSFTL